MTDRIASGIVIVAVALALILGSVLFMAVEGRCQVVPIIPGGPSGCRNVVIQTPNGSKFCVICTFGGTTTINCS